jgi:hypothetical protein
LRDAMSAYRLASDLDRDCNQVREVPGPDIRIAALCADLTLHHDVGLKTFEIAKG